MPSKHDGRADRAVIALLKEDHAEAKKAFAEFRKLHERGDEEACEALVRETCAALKAHAQLEEELFYPAARELLEDEQDMLDEADVEHATFKQLMQQLETLDSGDPQYAASFTVLGEYVKHHVQEEESEMFPSIEREKADWSALLEAMQSRHEALKREHGMLVEDRTRQPPARARAGARSAGRARGEARPHAAGESDDDDVR